ncbi:hypothetical protein M5K25_001644 [Dendrobium thyrsiflorum]|uniref:Uncharacterized protein n=1 Tax=Dendrobium thyrsiflorum TaxID=117978 RepID=A0ABD0VRZ4_DENTH
MEELRRQIFKEVTRQPLMLPNMRKNWFGKHLLYGLGTLVLRPIKLMRGGTQLLGVSHFCSISNIDSSLHIELFSYGFELCMATKQNYENTTRERFQC